jgi:GTP-sensing pleiotropic transcriptional regulator CodY
MERLLLLFFVFIGSFGFSQKQYHFDYAMLYDNVVKLNDTMSSNLHLVNSKDNSYGLFVSYNKDSTRVNLYFIQYDYTVAKFNLNKDLFFKAETINK